MEDEEAQFSLRGHTYFITSTLGEGSFGSVKTVYSEDGNCFAMKEFATVGDDEEPVEEGGWGYEFSDEDNAYAYDDDDYDDDYDTEYENTGEDVVPGFDVGVLREISALKLLRPNTTTKDYIFSEQSSTADSSLLQGSNFIMPITDIANVAGAEGLCMIMPKFMCSLEQAIKTKCLNNAAKLLVAHRLCGALAFLHNNNIIHRDIKSPNVLLCDDMCTPILADFSLAKIFDEELKGDTHTAGIGTLAYVSPEVYKGMPYGLSSDIYSLGVVLLELFNGLLPVDRAKASLQYISDLREKMGTQMVPKLLKAMLNPNPIQRPKAHELLEFDCFSKLPKICIDKIHNKIIHFGDVQSSTEKHGKKRKMKKTNKKKNTKMNDKNDSQRKQLNELKRKGEIDANEFKIRELWINMELSHTITYTAAIQYCRKTDVDPIYCLVLASKMYESVLYCDSDWISVDEQFSAANYAEAEIEIFKKMDFCLYI